MEADVARTALGDLADQNSKLSRARTFEAYLAVSIYRSTYHILRAGYTMTFRAYTATR